MLSLDALQENHHEAEYELAHDVPIVPDEGNDFQFVGISKRQSNALKAFFEAWVRRSPSARDTIAARIAYPEKSNKDIASLIQITEQHVSNILTSFFDTMAIRGRRNQRRKG
jgi:hypothetical protein